MVSVEKGAGFLYLFIPRIEVNKAKEFLHRELQIPKDISTRNK